MMLLEEIHGFRSPDEYRRFVQWLETGVATAELQEMPVEAPYNGTKSFEERWFRQRQTGRIWRLVSPDVPFRGVFERTDEE